MPEITIRERFSCAAGQLREIVSSLYDYAWRHDISRVQPAADGVFYEYTEEKTEYKTGEKRSFMLAPATAVRTEYRVTKFTVEKAEQERICVLFSDDKAQGRLCFEFAEEESGCLLTVNGEVSGKKFAMKPVARTYLKNRLTAYLANLRAAAKTPAEDTPDKMTAREIINEARHELKKTELYDELRHIYIIWNMFNGEWRSRSFIPQIEVASGEARLFMYRITESGDGGEALREVIREQRTRDYREAVYVVIDLVLNTAAAERFGDNAAKRAEAVEKAFSAVGGEYLRRYSANDGFLRHD